MANFAARKWPECMILHHISQGIEGPLTPTVRHLSSEVACAPYRPLTNCVGYQINLVGAHLAPKILPQLQTLQGRHFNYFYVLYIWHVGFHVFKMADPKLHSYFFSGGNLKSAYSICCHLFVCFQTSVYTLREFHNCICDRQIHN